MTGHNICYKGVLWEIIPKPSLLYLLIWSTDTFSDNVTHSHGARCKGLLLASVAKFDAASFQGASLVALAYRFSGTGFEPRSWQNLLNRIKVSIVNNLSLSYSHYPDMAEILSKMM